MAEFLFPKTMTLTDFKPQMRVAYIPWHIGRPTHFEKGHPDIEHGAVSYVGTHSVSVKFDKQVLKLGWLGTTAQSCDPGDLVREEEAR